MNTTPIKFAELADIAQDIADDCVPIPKVGQVHIFGVERGFDGIKRIEVVGKEVHATKTIAWTFQGEVIL